MRVNQKLYVQQDIHPERMRVLGQVPFYVVGPATAKALRHIEVATPFQPTTIHGAEAGNAESLALHMTHCRLTTHLSHSMNWSCMRRTKTRALKTTVPFLRAIFPGTRLMKLCPAQGRHLRSGSENIME